MRAAAAASYSLEEIKQGVVLGRIELNKSIIWIGRNEDECDVITAHASCSRRHACLTLVESASVSSDNHNNNNNHNNNTHYQLWLRDNGSAHGTYVNKKSLPKAACSKDESVKGVLLFVGDQIKFGASTRIYVVDGPMEMTREQYTLRQKLEKVRQKQIGESSSSHQQKTKQYDTGNTTTTTTSGNVEEKGGESQTIVKMRERLEARKHKLANLQLECDRIRDKELTMGVSLSEGQQSQLAKNEKRMTQLEVEIHDMEDKLIQGQQQLDGDEKPSSFSKSHRPVHEKLELMDEEDDFYDRTKQSNKSNLSNKAEDESSLKIKWKELINSYRKQEKVAQRAKTKVQELEMQLAVEEGDDVFFVQNDLQLAKDNQFKALEKLKTSKSELKETEDLLLFINKNIKFDRTNCIINSPSSKADSIESQQGQKRSHQIDKHKDDSSQQSKKLNLTMPPPPLSKSPMSPPQAIPPTQEAGDSKPQSLSLVKNMMPPAPRSKSVVTSMKSDSPPSSSMIQPSNSPKVRSTVVSGTLSSLKTLSNLEGDMEKAKSSLSNGRVEMSSTKKKNEFEETWTAPSNQTGDGKTRLNEKFAGRY